MISVPASLPVAYFFEAVGGCRAHIDDQADELAEVRPCKDWLLIMAPIVAVGYFLAHPSQFVLFMDWFARVLH
jgi:hypothetical protein